MAQIDSSIWFRLFRGAEDLGLALRTAIGNSRDGIFRSWILVPIGILLMLLACFGVDVVLKKFAVSFPASVACLVLLFLFLILSEAVFGIHRTRKLVSLIDISAGWSLRWINVFFTPSFVLLPLSPPVGVAEVSKMTAVFIVGYVVMMAMAAYLTRGLQLMLGSTKRAAAARAEELGEETEEIPIVEASRSEGGIATSSATLSRTCIGLDDIAAPAPPQLPQLRPQNDQSEQPENSQTPPVQSRPSYTQVPLPPSRSQRWPAIISTRMDWITYGVLFFFVGVPMYYITGYAMPIQLSLSVLAYFAAMEIPAHWRQYLHPVLVSSLATVLAIWTLAVIKGDSLQMALHQYRTGAKYLQLWEKSSHGLLPGAGDLFATVLDASIVSLALPMYQYRRELKEHFLAIVIPNVLISIGSLFAYPYICFAIGIGATRSLSFAARSLTLALATPATENLGGDLNTVAALAITSGILGVLIGQRILGMMKIPYDDYVTRGVALGANSSAIATALLLRTDPRAAALSSLSMSLFGTITVLFTSIPPVASIVRSLVGL